MATLAANWLVRLPTLWFGQFDLTTPSGQWLRSKDTHRAAIQRRPAPCRLVRTVLRCTKVAAWSVQARLGLPNTVEGLAWPRKRPSTCLPEPHQLQHPTLGASA